MKASTSRFPEHRVLALLLLLAGRSAFSSASLPFYEPFPAAYGDGTLLGAGTTAGRWDIGNTGSSLGAVVSNSAALAYAELNGSNSLGLLISGTPVSTRNKGATFTPQNLAGTNPTVYASFLLRVGQLPASSRLFAALSTSASGTGPSGVMGVWLDPAGRLLLSKNSSSTPSATNATPLPAGTHLVVLRYKWNSSAGDDELGLWLDPGQLGAAEGLVPAADVTTSSGTDVSPIQSFWILHPTTASVAATLNVDEIRVGANWEDVTPTNGLAAPTRVPAITQALLAPAGMILRGTNGPPNTGYQVIASTELLAPSSNWSSLAVHAFDANGNFDSTNPVVAGLDRQFFRLLVGGPAPPGPTAPNITNQPQGLSVAVGMPASFVVGASGTAPLAYFWSFNANTPVGGNSNTLWLPNVQTSDAGSYRVMVSNSVGAATSSVAMLTVTGPVTNAARFNLVGFGRATTGGGVIPETDAAYVKAYTPLDLADAIRSANKIAGSVKVIEVMNDLDLGWNEVGSVVQSMDSTPFRPHAAPQLHPRLIATGVSLIDIKSRSGLTIFSANGATVRHACFNVKSTANIIIRNLKFDELWEWDEDSKGQYDGNDWDFIDLGNGGTVTDVWIDHCTFTKAYDGIGDIKGGSYNITFSWNKYAGDDGATNPNSFVRQQLSFLESNRTSCAMYNFLRTHGFSVEDIVGIIQGHDKTHLIGANSLNSENAQHSVTFHHQWHLNPWDRLPRLRAGNVHNFNIYVDDTAGLAARRLRDARAAAMSPSDQDTLNNTYSFQVFLNGSISTENGAVLVEKSVYIDCLWPLRNNQTDANNPVYTGKIMALDTIYQFDSTFVRGNSTDPGNPLGPFQAAVVPFGWNTNAATPDGRLPYTYTMDDPSQLQSIVSSATGGAGAGVLDWDKTNWLMTTY